MKKTKSILILGIVWPEPNSSAAGTRMLQLISMFQQQGWKVTFASAAAESDFMFDLSILGIDRVSININDGAFNGFVKNLNPDLVLFDRFIIEEQFGWRVAEQCPNAMRILDTEDLHCLRLARQNAFQEKKEFSREDLFSDTAKREIASILRCDISLIISEFEMELLQNQFKIESTLLYYLPFLVDEINAEAKNWPEFEARKDFIFIGNFLHEPNLNTVQNLKELIWPLLRKCLPEASMLIYGAYPSQKVLQLHKPEERFLIMGRAENAENVVRSARVVLAPIRFGAGVKGKLLEAMQCGTPCATTSIGAESMYGNLPWNGIIADDAENFVNDAVILYKDELIWKQAQQNGIAIVNQRYKKSLHEVGFIRHLQKVYARLKMHRSDNFIGSLLMHHIAASTKYMSRWIEEKNKK